MSCRTTSSRTCLYLYLGSKDARGGPEEVRVLDVRPGDRLLMASDGLTGVVPDKDLAQILGTVDDPQQAAVMLKDLALANDSKDNVTCLIIHAVAQQESAAERPSSANPLTAPRARPKPTRDARSRLAPSTSTEGRVCTMLPLDDFIGQRRQVGTGSARGPGAGPSAARPRARPTTRRSGWRGG